MLTQSRLPHMQDQARSVYHDTICTVRAHRTSCIFGSLATKNGGANDTRIIAESGFDDRRVLDCRRKCFPQCTPFGDMEEQIDRLDHTATEDDPAWVQKIDRGCNAIAKLATGVFYCFHREFIAIRYRLCKQTGSKRGATGRVILQLRHKLEQCRWATTLEIADDRFGDGSP